MKAFFQSLGIVASLLVFALVTFVLLYLSYILAIGVVIALLVYTIYQALTAIAKAD